MTRPCFDGEDRSFTLIELLVGCSIIALLAAILFPALQAARLKAEQTVAVINLQQAGAAVQSYTADHDGALPGPMYAGVWPFYSAADFKNPIPCELATYLFSYLSSGATTNTSRIIPAFNDPAWVRATQKMGTLSVAPVYVMNTVLPIVGNPWGVWTPTTKGVPKRVAALNAAGVNLSQTVAMNSADQQNPIFVLSGQGSWFSQIPLKPVYGNKRNALFFDNHVESVSATATP